MVKYDISYLCIMYIVCLYEPTYIIISYIRVSDPHFFFADPDLDPDPGKNFDADPDPDPGGIRGRGLE